LQHAPCCIRQELVYRYTDDFARTRLLTTASCIRSSDQGGAAGRPAAPGLLDPSEEERAILFRTIRASRPASDTPSRAPWGTRQDRALEGELGVDVQLLSSSDPARPTMGYLLYMVSADGSTWSIPRALSPGHCRLNLGSLKDNRTLAFVGPMRYWTT